MNTCVFCGKPKSTHIVNGQIVPCVQSMAQFSESVALFNKLTQKKEEKSMTMLGTVTASLAGSGTPYLTAQVRAVDAGHCRYQGAINGHQFEITVTASAKLTDWLAAQPATGASMAGTAAKYTLCQIRPDTDGIRVQIAGPELNVPHGVEYVCHGWKDTSGMLMAALSGTTAPATKDELDGDPDEVADPDEDDEASGK